MFRWHNVASAHFSVFSFIVIVRLIVCNLDSLHLLTCYIDDAVYDWLWNVCALEMWANAQRDGRPAEYRWRPLFSAAKFG